MSLRSFASHLSSALRRRRYRTSPSRPAYGIRDRSSAKSSESHVANRSGVTALRSPARARSARWSAIKRARALRRACSSLVLCSRMYAASGGKLAAHRAAAAAPSLISSGSSSSIAEYTAEIAITRVSISASAGGASGTGSGSAGPSANSTPGSRVNTRTATGSCPSSESRIPVRRPRSARWSRRCGRELTAAAGSYRLRPP